MGVKKRYFRLSDKNCHFEKSVFKTDSNFHKHKQSLSDPP